MTSFRRETPAEAEEASRYPKVYAALQNLIKAGLVEVARKRSVTGWVRIYRLTPAGKRDADEGSGAE
jgi:DNA-binding PadR family transcriptional regulator